MLWWWLGRGGSDYTAAILGAALNATEIEIWIDVDGVMTTDPKLVKKAFPLHEMTFEEAMEMSHFGAKVIYPPTLQPAFHKRIPLRIRNAFNPKFTGTLIHENASKGDYVVKGISSIRDISLINFQGSGMVGMPGVSSRLFGALASHNINIILITQASSEHSICFALAFGIFGQIIGLFEAFKAIEKMGEVSQALLAGGLKVSSFTTIYGFFIFLLSSLCWFILNRKMAV